MRLKGWKRPIMQSSNQKTAGVAILILGKTDLKTEFEEK